MTPCNGESMEPAVPAYIRDRVSEEFRQLADLADAEFRANLRNLSADTAAVRAHDELLARASVFGYLYDRHFLASPELLVNELRWLRATNRPEVPRHALHPERFEKQRAALLELLISRFQTLLDYRDALDRPAPPPPPRDAPEKRATARKNVRQSSDPATEAD